MNEWTDIPSAVNTRGAKRMEASIFGLLCMLACSTAMADGDPVAGKSKSLICSGCHARDGNSKNPTYPILAGQGQGYLIKQLMDYKSGARKEDHMSPIVEAVSIEDIKDIAAYFSIQQRSQGAAPSQASELGKQMFHHGNSAGSVSACAGCHAEDGKGNTALKFPSLAGQHSDYVAKTLKAFRSAARSNDKQAVMRNIAANLGDKDIAALASYIASMR